MLLFQKSQSLEEIKFKFGNELCRRENALQLTKEAIDNIRLAAETQNADINKKNIDTFNLGK